MSAYEGDPKLFLDADGSTLRFVGGQPLMEQGEANVALIALFTEQGWCGNAFARSEREKIGSDFLRYCRAPITMASLNDIRIAAEGAMVRAGFSSVIVEVTNPVSTRLKVVVKAKSPSGQDFYTRLLSVSADRSLYDVEVLTFDGVTPLSFGSTIITF
jgi:hypothetical protein